MENQREIEIKNIEIGNWLDFKTFLKVTGLKSSQVRMCMDDGSIADLHRVIDGDLEIHNDAYEIIKSANYQENEENFAPRAGLDYEISKAKEKEFKARLSELEYHKKLGDLVPRKDIEKTVFEVSRKVRNNILNIPTKIMDVLASMNDPHEIEKLLVAELHQALESLSDDIESN